MDDPDQRIFINPDVCEGCGDCSVQSNCISIEPIETEFGRKRKINQSACNKDYSCLKGFCPSFVTVAGAKIAARATTNSDRLEQLIAALPAPPIAPLDERGWNILVGGVGGTGVLTIGALLGMAAHLDGKAATILDMTGMAQKGGAVTSHVRIAPDPESIFVSRLSEGMSDVIIAADMIVGAGAPVLKSVKPGQTAAVLNSDVAPTGNFQSNRDAGYASEALRAAIADALDGGAIFDLDATKLATELTGDSIGTNILMLGFTAQKGLLPVSIAAIEEAIRLNGSFVAGNLRTFALGRLAAHDRAALAQDLAPQAKPVPLETVDDVLASRMRLLGAYQDQAYAGRYRDFIEGLRGRAAHVKGGEAFVREAALTLARLMAYKDEYEVARLYADPAFEQRLREQFTGDFKISFHLASDMLLPGRDGAGRPKKRKLPGAMMLGFKLLAKMKGLRGTPFDPFGALPERRLERRLIEDYRALIAPIAEKLTEANLSAAIELARAASEIRGYGPVKEASAKDYEARLPRLLRNFDAASKQPEPQPA